MRKWLLRSLVLMLIWLAPGVLGQENSVFDVDWQAEYFNNPYLAGVPNITEVDENIAHDWSDGLPVDTVRENSFSVRWGKGGHFVAGTYRFIVTASYGFRLYIDGEVVIDTWEGGADGITVGRDYFIEAGTHSIQIDYRALNGNPYIYLDWGLAPDGEVDPQPTNIISEDTVTVVANVLNVRSEPRIINNIVARVTRGQQYIQLDTSEEGRWIQIDLGNGVTGWVSARYVVPSFIPGNRPQ